MNICESFLALGEYGAAGMFEMTEKSLFFRKSLGLRRYFENCELHAYNGELLYPSGVATQKMKVLPNYITGLDVSEPVLSCFEKELADALRNDFCIYSSTVPKEHAVAGNMYTHSIPNYERIVREGLESYAERVKRIKDNDMREGLLHLIEGITAYVNRCVVYLESVNADEKLINALKKVPMSPAENVYEAIVSWNFILYLDNCDNLGSLPRSIEPYYNGEDIKALLENLYDNLDQNNGYSMSVYGCSDQLAILCLEAAKGKRRPMIELFVDENTSQSVWQTALDTVKSGGGQPAFYNPHVLLEGLMKRFPGINSDDIKKFCGGGCTESMISGLSNVGSLDAGVNLALIFEKTLYEKLKSCDNFEEFYGEYIKDVKKTVDSVKKEINNSRRQRAKYNPLPMRTLLVDDCIDNGADFNDGGARYNFSIINFAGMINVIDSMLATNELVFVKKRFTKEHFLKLLSSNDETLSRLCTDLELTHGKDIGEVNAFSKRISTDVFSMTEGTDLYKGEGFLSASIQFRSQISAGKRVGATPDGRRSQAPLCDSLGAIFGKDVKGPTALLNSVTSLALDKALGVPVLNFNIQSRFDNGILKALILGYMKNGGVQIQITCASKEELMDALVNPHLHKNLIVRVAGYSEYFNNLTDELKRMVIARTIQENI